MIASLLLPERVAGELLDHAAACVPNEACGLFGGRVAGHVVEVTTFYPLPSLDPSPTRFAMDATPALDALEAAGEELVATFHSHPRSQAVPSWADRGALGAWPDVVHAITSLDPPELRGWVFPRDGVWCAWCEVLITRLASVNPLTPAGVSTL